MTIQTLTRKIINSLALLILLAVSVTPTLAGDPVIWETGSRTELLRGDVRGVSITDTGALLLAPQFAQMFNTEQPYVWASATDGAGNIYLGTGHDGKLYKVGADGKGSLLYDAAELRSEEHTSELQ